MKLSSKLMLIPLALTGSTLCADQLTVTIDGFGVPDETLFKITETETLSLRVSELVPSDGPNSSTHMLIEGLSPLEDGTLVYASTYAGINVDSGETQDSGVLYLEMPEGSGLPEGTVASPIVGVVQRSGGWDDYSLSFPPTSVGGSAGSGDYDTGSISLSLSRNSDLFTGTATYAVLDADTLTIEPFTLSENAGLSYDMSGATLIRDGGKFVGTLTNLSNGAVYDSLIFALELTDIPDVDLDGVPDISDDSIEAGDNTFITWFNQGDSTTLQYDNTLAIDADQWHWSYYFKGMFHAPSVAETTIWMREFGSFFYFAVDSGLGSPAGVWTYGFDFPVDGSGTWTWIAGNNFAPTVEGNDVIDGWLYLAAPYAKWYKVKEFDTLAEPGTYLFTDGENYRLTTAP